MRDRRTFVPRRGRLVRYAHGGDLLQVPYLLVALVWTLRQHVLGPFEPLACVPVVHPRTSGSAGATAARRVPLLALAMCRWTVPGQWHTCRIVCFLAGSLGTRRVGVRCTRCQLETSGLRRGRSHAVFLSLVVIAALLATHRTSLCLLHGVRCCAGTLQHHNPRRHQP
jgi:hypothetical protein